MEVMERRDLYLQVLPLKSIPSRDGGVAHFFELPTLDFGSDCDLRLWCSQGPEI